MSNICLTLTLTLKQTLRCKDQQTFQKRCHYLKYNEMQNVLRWDQFGRCHSSRSSHPFSCLSLIGLQRLSRHRMVSPVTQSRPKQVQKIDRSFLITEELEGGNVFIPSIWRQVKRWGWKIWAPCRRYLSAKLFPSLSLVFHRLLPDLFRPEMAQRAWVSLLPDKAPTVQPVLLRSHICPDSYEITTVLCLSNRKVFTHWERCCSVSGSAALLMLPR